MQLMGGAFKIMFFICRPLGEYGQVEEGGFVWRREVFTRTGRNCILLSNGLLFFRVWGPDIWNFSYFFRDRVQFGPKEIIGSVAVWVHSASEIIAMKLCLICTTRVEQLVRLRPTPIYCEGLGCHSAP